MKEYTDKEWATLDIPTMILFGEYDSAGELDARVLIKMKNSKKKIAYGAGKHCYVDDPKHFMDNSLLFLQSLPPKIPENV